MTATGNARLPALDLPSASLLRRAEPQRSASTSSCRRLKAPFHTWLRLAQLAWNSYLGDSSAMLAPSPSCANLDARISSLGSGIAGLYLPHDQGLPRLYSGAASSFQADFSYLWGTQLHSPFHGLTEVPGPPAPLYISHPPVNGGGDSATAGRVVDAAA